VSIVSILTVLSTGRHHVETRKTVADGIMNNPVHGFRINLSRWCE